MKRVVIALALLTGACSQRRWQVCVGEPASGNIMRLDPQRREDAEKKALFFNAAGGGQITAWVQRTQPHTKDPNSVTLTPPKVKSQEQ